MISRLYLRYPANPCCSYLPKHVCVSSTSVDPIFGLYCKYTERSLDTISGKERIIRRDHEFEQDQYVQILGHDDLAGLLTILTLATRPFIRL